MNEQIQELRSKLEKLDYTIVTLQDSIHEINAQLSTLDEKVNAEAQKLEYARLYGFSRTAEDE